MWRTQRGRKDRFWPLDPKNTEKTECEPRKLDKNWPQECGMALGPKRDYVSKKARVREGKEKGGRVGKEGARRLDSNQNHA